MIEILVVLTVIWILGIMGLKDSISEQVLSGRLEIISATIGLLLWPLVVIMFIVIFILCTLIIWYNKSMEK